MGIQSTTSTTPVWLIYHWATKPLGAKWWGVRYLYTSALVAYMVNSSKLSLRHPRGWRTYCHLWLSVRCSNYPCLMPHQIVKPMTLQVFVYKLVLRLIQSEVRAVDTVDDIPHQDERILQAGRLASLTPCCIRVLYLCMSKHPILYM